MLRGVENYSQRFAVPLKYWVRGAKPVRKAFKMGLLSRKCHKRRAGGGARKQCFWLIMKEMRVVFKMAHGKGFLVNGRVVRVHEKCRGAALLAPCRAARGSNSQVAHRALWTTFYMKKPRYFLFRLDLGQGRLGGHLRGFCAPQRRNASPSPSRMSVVATASAPRRCATQSAAVPCHATAQASVCRGSE